MFLRLRQTKPAVGDGGRLRPLVASPQPAPPSGSVSGSGGGWRALVSITPFPDCALDLLRAARSIPQGTRGFGGVQNFKKQVLVLSVLGDPGECVAT